MHDFDYDFLISAKINRLHRGVNVFVLRAT